ncbi:hypothetical protein LMG27174_05198 [Paraburkholderia rhynchosiae]|uniref:DUF421 domain-containing protein n=2 Tax=Paraburkholderia rhynchosiae TaxID=487049 RepID=A0A2N7WDM5_9BURK|nr:DUF421 domain-containing protein [Paraburkholderia rhynchosiae]CAB3723991.1 hypothetical protein LMG27174_05198 [Paraburkholderia rhynchosiae]
MTALDDLVGTLGHVTPMQECVRAAVVFFWGLLLVRVAGRRIFGRWAALDIVVAIIVGSNLSRALTGGAPFIGTLLATTLMIAMHWIIAHLASRSRFWSFLAEGGPVTLVIRGTPCKRTLMRYGVSGNDINEAPSQKDLHDITEAEQITLEPSGKINATPTSTVGRQ